MLIRSKWLGLGGFREDLRSPAKWPNPLLVRELVSSGVKSERRLKDPGGKIRLCVSCLLQAHVWLQMRPSQR